MSVPSIQSNLSAGEIDPKLWGHVDLGKVRAGVATARNVFVAYTGGLYSRAGTALVGRCKQEPPAAPPRDITFLFSINQGYALEFGDNYMRVKSAGEYALEPAIAITAATNANPIEVTAASLGITDATLDSAAALIGTYAPNDDITVAGGSFVTPAILAVTTTALGDLSVGVPGIGDYAPGDTVNLAGGTQTSPAQITVSATQVVSATIANAGSGGTDGDATVTGTTGTGTKFQADVTIAGGVITVIKSITVHGAYTVNPTSPSAEPVTGGGLSGAQLHVVLGILSITISLAGIFTANPVGGNFAQASSSGSGTGATFIGALLFPHALTVADPGVYTVVPANPVSQSSTTGQGAGATFNLTNAASGAFNAGDWVFFTGVGGMTQLNGNTYIVAAPSGDTFSLTDLDGNPIDSTNYGVFTAGGTVARIFTLVTPYAAVDLPYLKYTQDTDTMSLTCVNLATRTEYPPQELKRLGATNWAMAPLAIGSTVPAPTGVTGVASDNPDSFLTPPTRPCAYAYVVTAVDLITGQQSVASVRADVINSVDMGVTAGSITVTWKPISWKNPVAYNVYRTAPAYNTQADNVNQALPVPAGSAFYFAGSSYGAQFVDTNTVTDASTTPPLHIDPFAPGQVPSLTITSSSNDWTQATMSISTASGTGWDAEAVITSDELVAGIVDNPGEDFMSGDQLVITGDGTSATGILNIGPESGTYPAVTAYFQTRRMYAQTLNQPDNFWASRSENFTNFDSANPPIATDSISASPFSQAVNGIQWMIPSLGGLVLLTGSGAWQLTGSGGSAFSPVPITPSSLQATPQAFNGSDAIWPPVRVNYDILFLSSTGQFFYDLNYNIYFNNFTVIDISWTSGHLFLGNTFTQDAWCLQPYKLLWTLRGDGTLLSLTWLKEQEIAGWARHDTQGIFQGVCTVSEPPIDALYLIVQRYVQNRWLYFSERMDNRIWNSGENCWCVDCGVSTLTASRFPNAILTAAASSGANVIVSASAAVFSAGNVGNIIRAGNGIATITHYTDTQHVTVTWTRPMSQTIPGDPNNTPFPVAAGSWSMLPQVMTVTGLPHLAGKQAVGLADGIPIGPFTVSDTGSVALPFLASLITLGLGFLPQVQSMYLDEGQPTIQGRRKTINSASVRLAASGWPFVTTNQPDGSTLDPMQIAPVWAPGQQMKPSPPGQTSPSPPYRTASGQLVQPLTTGDVYSNVASTYRKPGQIALQQPLPLPMNVVAIMPDSLAGDMPEAGISPRQAAPQRQAA